MHPVFTFFILRILYTKNSLGFRIVLGVAWTAVLLGTSFVLQPSGLLPGRLLLCWVDR